jgi:hypothetical protein
MAGVLDARFGTAERLRLILCLQAAYCSSYIRLMGYLLHSGDPKILWLRTVRFAPRPWRTGLHSQRKPLECSLRVIDFGCTRRRAASIRADLVGHMHSQRPGIAGHGGHDHNRGCGYLSEVNIPLRLC